VADVWCGLLLEDLGLADFLFEFFKAMLVVFNLLSVAKD